MVRTFIEDLIRAGMSEKEIADAIGRSQPSVNRMRNGKQRTDYETGLKLERLHRDRCAGAPEFGLPAPVDVQERAA
jgi:transcriptional regulator with XRE-family HTH domain